MDCLAALDAHWRHQSFRAFFLQQLPSDMAIAVSAARGQGQPTQTAQ